MDKDNLTKQARNRIVAYVGLLLLVAVAVTFSLTIFSKTSLRLDEAQSLFQTNRDLGGMLYVIAQDVHVPFYHVLLHFWQLFFGNDIFVARMLSLVFFLGTILGTYALGTYAFNRRSIGLFAALLVAISPFMNWYGSEARMYSMLAFFVVVHQLFFLKLMREPKPLYWVMFTLTAIAGMYTHYFFGFVLLSEVVAYIVLRRRYFKTKRPFLKFTLSATAVGLAAAPWLVYVRSLGTASNTQPLLPEPTAVDLFGTYTQFLFGFHTAGINTIIISFWPLLVLLAFFALQRSGRAIPASGIVFIITALLPVIAAFVISIVFKPLYVSRYLIVALPALLLFLSWFFTQYRRSVAVVMRVALVVIIGVLFYMEVTNSRTPVKEDYSQAVEYLHKNASATDVIVLAAPFTIYPVDYYYQGAAKLTTQPIWDRFKEGSVPAFDKQKLAEETKQNIGEYQRAWLMLSYDQGYNEELKQYYDTHFERISAEVFSPGLTIYQYKLRYDDGVTIEP